VVTAAEARLEAATHVAQAVAEITTAEMSDVAETMMVETTAEAVPIVGVAKAVIIQVRARGAVAVVIHLIWADPCVGWSSEHRDRKCNAATSATTLLDSQGHQPLRAAFWGMEWQTA
jgi:hypothetical protein